MIPCHLRNLPNPGTRVTSTFATKLMFRGDCAPTTGMSTHERWLIASTQPPASGIRSRP